MDDDDGLILECYSGRLRAGLRDISDELLPDGEQIPDAERKRVKAKAFDWSRLDMPRGGGGLTKAYNPLQMRDINGRWTSFGAFVDHAMTVTDQHLIYQVGEVMNAVEIRAAVGVDLIGWSRRVDNYALRHATVHHGVEEVEARRGQIAVGPADFRHIPEVVTRPDRILDGGSDERGLRVVVSEKVIGQERLFVAEEIRGRKHRTLVMVTMWKRKEK